MPKFEYKVVTAPNRGKRGKGVRGNPAKFANALASVMNDLGADGWEYVRADTLPCEERAGLTKRATAYHNMLVFRRLIEDAVAVPAQVTTEAPAPQTAVAPPAISHTSVPTLKLATPAEDPWAKYAMDTANTPDVTDVDPMVVDLLSERKARADSVSPAALKHQKVAE